LERWRKNMPAGASNGERKMHNTLARSQSKHPGTKNGFMTLPGHVRGD
jgi:hypothetical protein